VSSEVVEASKRKHPTKTVATSILLLVLTVAASEGGGDAAAAAVSSSACCWTAPYFGAIAKWFVHGNGEEGASS
jgi:hypothetical protein